MNFSIDTNILLRFAEDSHPHHQIAVNAIQELQKRDDELAITPQVITNIG